MGALEQDRGERRVRSNPWATVGIAAVVVLVVAWIAWAIYVAADKGGREALGVLIAWPLIVLALAIVSMAVIWAVRRIRGRGGDSSASPRRDSVRLKRIG